MEAPANVSGWKITMLLADSAQAVGGKLYILRGGWSLTGPAPQPSALAIKFAVPWDAANVRHEVRLELVDSDGKNIEVAGPVGPQPFVVTMPLEVGRPPGILKGTPHDVPFALNFGPIPLSPGRYEWRCTIVGTNAIESCAFTVRDQPPTAQAQIALGGQ